MNDDSIGPIFFSCLFVFLFSLFVGAVWGSNSENKRIMEKCLKDNSTMLYWEVKQMCELRVK
jgi:hypothetical protein